jgi:hypothetical protein
MNDRKPTDNPIAKCEKLCLEMCPKTQDEIKKKKKKDNLCSLCNIPSPKGLGLLIIFLTCKYSIRFIN